MKKPDEIMAEYLLKGGKMLAKTCNTCSSPLFEYKGETFCVICREEAAAIQTENANQAIQETQKITSEIPQSPHKTQEELPKTLNDEFALTIASLLRQARDETDTRRLKHLMQAIKDAADAYSTLFH